MELTSSWASLEVEEEESKGGGDVTERTHSRFPLQYFSQQKKSIKGKRCGLSTALDTLFFMAL